MITDKNDRSVNYLVVEAILEYLEREGGWKTNTLKGLEN